jgi:hypothetical protein
MYIPERSIVDKIKPCDGLNKILQVREKQIPATKIGRWRIKPEDLEEFVRSRSNI